MIILRRYRLAGRIMSIPNFVVLLLLASTLVNSCDAHPILDWFRKFKGSKGKQREDPYDPNKEVLIGFAYSKSIRGSEGSDFYHSLDLPREELFGNQMKPKDSIILDSTISLLQRGDFADELPNLSDRGRTGLYPYEKCYITLGQNAFDEFKPKIIYSSLPSSLPSYREGSTKLPTYEESHNHPDTQQVVTVTRGKQGHLIMHIPYNTIWRGLYHSLKVRCLGLIARFPNGIEDSQWENWNIPNLPPAQATHHEYQSLRVHTGPKGAN
ncbi:hypothetical protein DFH05DRAFT_1527914 [Lentinula detonsa]|uniref:Uncharacterized protein n=1 Tax=Lentinula detonsa TaxID=2804962 RepID=A0A9W8NWS6_9AGAR|nr:hypothetical protein DFH05DRAFT_1527914 [Lentinula detonsa]